MVAITQNIYMYIDPCFTKYAQKLLLSEKKPSIRISWLQIHSTNVRISLQSYQKYMATVYFSMKMPISECQLLTCCEKIDKIYNQNQTVKSEA